MKKLQRFLKITLLGLLSLILITCQKEEPLSKNQIIDSESLLNSQQLKSTNSVSDYLLDLIGMIEAMVSEGSLNKGNGNALISKIKNAIKSVDKGNTNAASGQLNAFINQIEAFMDNGKITMEQGQELINKAENGIILSEGSFIDPRDGYEYPVVLIGNQLWMAENLKTTHYSNGDFIETTDPPTLIIKDEINPKYQWAFNGDESNVETYGRLYTWYVVTDPRGLCPTGWHMPTKAEWITLINYLGGWSDAGGLLKEQGTTHWVDPNIDATNQSGFTALPGGSRNDSEQFIFMGLGGYWWTFDEEVGDYAWGVFISHYQSEIIIMAYWKKAGLSVRCLKD